MRLFFVSSAAALALAFSTAAFADGTMAQSPTPPAAAAQPAAPAPATAASTTTAAIDDPDEVICRQQAAMTGTRLGAPRVCRKRKDWDRLQKEAAASLGHMQTSGLQGNGFVKANMQAGPTGH